MNSLKMINCVKCEQQTPGFDKPFNDIQLLEGGKRTDLNDPDTIKYLNESKVLKTTIKLSQNFENSNLSDKTSKSATGVCTDCSRYYELSNNGDIIPKVSYPAFVQSCKDTSNDNEDINNQQQNFNFNLVNPYSIENLMSTDVFNDMEHK